MVIGRSLQERGCSRYGQGKAVACGWNTSVRAGLAGAWLLPEDVTVRKGAGRKSRSRLEMPVACPALAKGDVRVAEMKSSVFTI